VKNYEQIRDMVHKKLIRFIRMPCYNRTDCFSKSYQEEMNFYMDHWKNVNKYCNSNNLDYDAMEKKYGPAVTDNKCEDPWAYSKMFEKIYGAPVQDFTGKYPISVEYD
jgi:hypothetical protein